MCTTSLRQDERFHEKVSPNSSHFDYVSSYMYMLRDFRLTTCAFIHGRGLFLKGPETFRVPQSPLCLRNGEVLSDQSLQSSWFFLQ